MLYIWWYSCAVSRALVIFLVEYNFDTVIVITINSLFIHSFIHSLLIIIISVILIIIIIIITIIIIDYCHHYCNHYHYCPLRFLVVIATYNSKASLKISNICICQLRYFFFNFQFSTIRYVCSKHTINHHLLECDISTNFLPTLCHVPSYNCH